MKQELQLPDHSVFMQTNRDFRLSSLNGCVINFKANTPHLVPPNAYREAIGIGAVVCDEQPQPKPVEEKVERHGIAEAAKLEAEAKFEYIKQACLQLLAQNDNTAFKADGRPKMAQLIAAMPPEAPRPTAQEIAHVFDELTQDMDLAED